MEPGFERNPNWRSESTFDIGEEKILGNDNAIFITQRKFVERHLFIEDKDFLICPNGGTGDCCFKAIAQAIDGSEVDHHKIREEVVNFVINHRWDKLKESIEVQHIHGNKFLQKTWVSDPMSTYQNYMNTAGMLGSSTELNAAGELFHFNFVMIQEYSDSEKKSYRVEICNPFSDPCVPFHFFYFTGDFDNGHWEYLDPLGQSINKETISDGMYPGLVKVLIEGLETTVEEWFKIHTFNTNDEVVLKHTICRYPSVQSPYPFESEDYSYISNATVLLKGLPYRVSHLARTDLFTVLFAIIFPEVDQTDTTLLDKLEDQIVTYRIENIALLNYKLITQPHSHGFDVGTLKFVGMTCKGNVQDLLAAADLFGFSFEIFIKPEQTEPYQFCRFVHVDRWGGETDRVLHFVMRLSPGSGPYPFEDLLAKWWHVTPVPQPGSARASPQISNNHLHVTGDFITVSGDQNYNTIRRGSATKSGSRRSSKQEISVCGSVSGDEIVKENVKLKNKVPSSNYDLASNEEHWEEEDNTSVKMHVGKTESDSESNIKSNTQLKKDKSKSAGKTTISKIQRKSRASKKINRRPRYATSSKSRSISRSRHLTKDAISLQKNKDNNKNKNRNLAKDNSDNYSKVDSENVSVIQDHQSSNRPVKEKVVKIQRVPKENKQSHYSQRIIADLPEIDKTPQIQATLSDQVVMNKGSKKGKFTGNPSTMPKIQTQVYIYDEATKKKREYRFQGVKTREQVLQKLLKLGYIKRIPDSDSPVVKIKSQENVEELLEPRFTEGVKLSETRLTGQIPMKNVMTELMQASEKYKMKSNRDKLGSKWSFHFNNRRQTSPPRGKSLTATNKHLSHEISSQNVSNQNYIQQTLRDQQGGKKSWENLQLPRPRSASALALVDQDSVENRNTFLTRRRKPSPWAQRKAERIDNLDDAKVAKQKNLLDRFVDWVADFFENCKKMKVASVGGDNE